MYHSQHNIDSFIHKNYIKAPVEGGTFIELGAIDGVRFSNTKFFEDQMGFNKGLLIEPVVDSFLRLVKNRPNCFCFNKAIHSTLSQVNFLQGSVNAVGCVESVANDEFKDKWHTNSTLVTISAVRLDALIHACKFTYIDFWSLDVEGSELEVLKSMDWDIPVGLLCVEMHNSDSDKIDSIIKSKGFELTDCIGGVNNLYINRSYHRLSKIIS